MNLNVSRLNLSRIFKVTTALMLLNFAVVTCHAQEEEPKWTDQIIGAWQCDMEETLAAMNKIKPLTEDQTKSMKEVLPGIGLVVQKDSLVLKTEIDRLSDEKTASYEIESSEEEGNTLTLKAKFSDGSEQTGKVTFVKVKNKDGLSLEFEDGGVLVFLKILVPEKK